MRKSMEFYLPVVVLLILISVTSCSLFVLSNVTFAEAVTTNPYAYSVNISIKPVAVYALSPQKVFLVGMTKGSTIVEILDVSNPLAQPTVLQSYPLVGNPTVVATNGYPVSRIAVGTDAGDLVLFKVDGGKVYLLLHAVLGTDFSINKLLILKGSKDYKLAVMAVEGKAPTGGVCTKCHVYVFDELSGGAMRVGLNEGNASLTINNVLPQDISAALVVSNGNYYYDAGKFVVTWLPAKFYIILVNATYVTKDGTIEKARHALVDIITYSKELREMYHYGINLGRDGTAEIPVPWGFDANLTLTDVNGEKYTKHVEAPNASEVTKVYVSFKLNAPPVTAEATTLYKVPPYEMATPHIIDVDNVPNSFSAVTSLNDTRINPASTGLSLLKGVGSPNFALYYYDPSTGEAHVKVYTASFEALSEVTDYVGVKLNSLGAFTYPDERIIITAYEEGKIKYYIASSNSYKFFYELTLGGTLNKVEIVPSTEGYYYIAHTTAGLQVVRTYPYQVPILRYGTWVNYAEGSVDGDIGGNLNYGVVAYSDHLIILRNIESLIKEGKPTDLESIRVPKLYVKVNPPEGLPLNGTRVSLIYPGGTLEKILEKSNTAVFPNILPHENYTLVVNYTKPYVNKVVLNITPTEYKDIHITVDLTYKLYSLTLNIRDSISGTEIVAPYDVLIDNKVVLKNIKKSTLTIPVVYGNHTIIVRPASGYENVYEESTIHTYVTGHTTANITLARKRFTLNVVVMDKYSKRLLAPVVVEVVKGVSKIIGFGGTKASFMLPYGNYVIHVSPLKGYSNIYLPTTASVTLNKPSTVTLVLERVRYTLNISIKDVTTGVLAGLFDVYVNGSKVASGVRSLTNVTLPYGVYVVSITPGSKYASVYSTPRPQTVKVFNNTEVVFKLSRKFFKVKIIVVDDVGAPIKNAEVKFFSIDKGAYVSTLLTDASGTVQGSLFYGGYRIDVVAKGYYPVQRNIILNKDTELTITLQPQLLTVIMRYSIVIIVVCIAAVAIVAILKVKTKIAERLPKEELF